MVTSCAPGARLALNSMARLELAKPRVWCYFQHNIPLIGSRARCAHCRMCCEAESPALFGMPLSGVVTEQGVDGWQCQVQWFRRARFELYPEHAPLYYVLLGLLSNELRTGGLALQHTAADFEHEVIRLTNLERTSRGLAPLQQHSALTATVCAYNDDIVRNHLFDHNGSNGSESWDRACAQSYPATYGVGMMDENTAYGYATPAQVVRGWMDSEGHRNNILSPGFHDIGVGYLPGKSVDNQSGLTRQTRDASGFVSHMRRTITKCMTTNHTGNNAIAF